MRLFPYSLVLLGLAFTFSGAGVSASEAEELRDRARAMRKEAAALVERGHREEAERLHREAAKLLETAERLEARGKDHKRPEIEKEIHHLKTRLQDMLAKEKHLRETRASERALAEMRELIAATERELHALHERHGKHEHLPPHLRAQVEKLDAASKRIHHLRVAAENLKLAEAHDLARQLMEKAEAMEHEVHEGKKRLAAEMHKKHEHHHEHGPDVVRELRAEIERLKTEVEQLRKQGKGKGKKRR